MENFTCIAVDMGAGSIRVMLGTVNENEISYKEVHRIINETIEYDGHDCWDIEKIVTEIRNGISKALEISAITPTSIGVDSWGVDFVHLDEKNKLLDVPIAYRDVRTEGMQERWKSMMSEMDTFQRTGINFYIFNSLFQLLSLKDSQVIRKTSKILFLPSYINFLLSGHSHNELTISSTSQILKVTGKQWDPEIMSLLNLDKDLFGEVIDSGSRLGPVIIPEAIDTGMESIAVCGHDTACVVTAIPVENPNFAYISAGTWCIVGIESDQPLISKEAMQLGFTNERGYKNTYRTLKNIVGLWLVQGLKKHLPENTSYSEMEEMTKKAGNIEQVINPDDASFYNPENMKEAFDSYFLKTGQAIPSEFGEYLVCAYDSLCFSFKYHIEKLEKLSGKAIEVLHLLGGGSQSDHLNQRIATICGRQVVSGPVEGATLGNILIQAMAMGKIKNLEEGRTLVKHCYPGNVYSPKNESIQTHERYLVYQKLRNV